MQCVKLKVKFAFKYDSDSPFRIDLSWENPSTEQIGKVRDYIVQQFNDEIERLIEE